MPSPARPPQTDSDRELAALGYDLWEECRRAVTLAGLGDGDSVLDVATGQGRMAFALAAAGCRVVSGDVSAEAIREAQERIGALAPTEVDFRVLDAARLEIPDGGETNVVMANALHHMEQPGLALEEMTRVLGAPGRLLLVEFNARGFEVIDRVHQKVHGQRHPPAGLSPASVCEFLRARFDRVEHHVLPLTNVWIAAGKRPGGAPGRRPVHGQCFACGPTHPDGLRLQFEPDGPDGVVARCTVAEKFQGYDGVVQGGIVSLLLDSAMTNCLFQLGIRAMTARLAVRFRKPVRTETPLTVRARLVESGRPARLGKAVYTLSASVEQDGSERASASGTFVHSG